MKSLCHRVLASLLLLISVTLAPLLAQGGPPLISDDPDTPGPGYWEVNFVLQHERTHLDQGEELLADLNYGVGRRVQLKLEAPWAILRAETGEHLSGPGNAVAGVKWRFFGQEEHLLAWAIYPQYEFNLGSSSAQKGLVPEGHRLILPTELTVEVRGLEVSLEVGRILGSGDFEEWVYGVSTEVSLLKRVEFLAEVHGEKTSGGQNELILHGGARVKASCKITLMAGAGWAASGDADDRPRLLVSGGVQINWPGRFDFSPAASPTRHCT
jgi:hypothetical protein